MSAPTFEQLVSWIEAGRLDQVTDALVAATESERRALAPQLKAYQPTRPAFPSYESHSIDPMEAYRQHERGRRRYETLVRDREGALRVAGAACLPRAADVVAWLRSDRFWETPSPAAVDALVLVLSEQGRPALPSVAQQLADRLRPAQADRQWPLVSGLLTAAGLTPPTTEAVVRGWIREIGRGQIAGRLRAHPHTDVLLPHVFRIPRVAADLGEEWPPALARLVADGDYPRADLLADVLLRLRAGDRPGAVRVVVQLHRSLAPTTAEYAEHRQEYLGMLSSPQVAVADLALTALRAVDDTDGLPADAIAEAAYAVLPRPEKKLVRAVLDWLDAALPRTGDPQLFAALTAGLSNDAIDLAERALKLTARHLPTFGDEGRTMLRDAADALDGDLRRQADALLGGTPVGTPGAAVDTGAPRPAPVPPPAPMPPPIASVAELTAAAATLMRTRDDPILFERFVAALPVLVRADRSAVAATLTPLIPEYWTDSFVLMMQSAVTGRRQKYAPNEYERNPARPSLLTAQRCIELAGQLAGEPPAALLATPATVDGHVDPARVLELLAKAEAAGTQPGPHDLTQALLRLPRTISPEIAAAAARLNSPTGRAFARWITGGMLADPDVSVVGVQQKKCRHGYQPDGGYMPCSCNSTASHRRTVTFPPLAHPDLPLAPELLSRPPEHAYAQAYGYHHYTLSLASWPLAFPSHRELVAAYVQPLLAPAADGNVRGGGDLLPALARASGPLGPAFALCLAYGLTAGRPAERLAATDAFVLTAARDDLDGADLGTLVGHELAALHDAGVLVLRRVAEALTGALRAGAAAEVWAAARALVPAALTASAGGPDLLALATAAASAVGAREAIPEVEKVAARGGRTRMVTEAGRLARTLAAPK
ncbi:hypothetical protein [Actinoplanes aureus]|uniref:Secreted protein n=1 Tax=Actinoplanes aureus TaxID=2792083 RepID=A0A931CGZ8_9ACTN|nr:hypothetical protein [Actinoplanes aureus]MBG0567827.1 hypothetical protein [Actinoplanes aureus]